MALLLLQRLIVPPPFTPPPPQLLLILLHFSVKKMHQWIGLETVVSWENNHNTSYACTKTLDFRLEPAATGRDMCVFGALLLLTRTDIIRVATTTHPQPQPRPDHSMLPPYRPWSKGNIIASHNPSEKTLHCCRVSFGVFNDVCTDSTYAGHHLLSPTS